MRIPGLGGDGDGDESQGGETIGEDGESESLARSVMRHAMLTACVEVMGGGKPFRKVGDQVYILENDELVTEDDPKGDQKIDKDGNLLGGVFSFLRQ